MRKVIVQEYDLTKRTRPFQFKTLAEFELSEVPINIDNTLRAECATRGFHNYRFWSIKGDTLYAVVGDAEALAKLDFDANEAEQNAP